jgi:hypothetical protein
LRRLRGSRTLADVVGHLGWSESKLSRIESGKLNISRPDLDRLVDLFATSEQQRARLTSMTDRQRRPAWWEPYTDALTDPYEAYIVAESRAKSIISYEAQVVHGLLQTAEYAHAVTQADSNLRDAESINQRVQVRMARKAVLIREPQPQLRVVLDEAVLARHIGGTELFKRQMLSLMEASSRPNVTLQVLSFATGAHRALSGSFTVLEFFDEAEPPLVYSEGLTGGVIGSDPNDVRVHCESFEAVCAMALNQEESRGMIRKAAGF